MAPKKNKKQAKIKVKKKTWFKVLAPSVFGKKEVGESYLVQAEDALGRVMKVNLRNLTGSIRDQNVDVTLKISDLKSSILHTEVVGYELVSTHVKRMVRKRTSRIDNVFRFKSKDGKEVILKSLLVTFNRNTRSTGVALQNALQEILAEEFKSQNFAEIVGKLAANKLQYGIKKKLKNIFPVKEFAVRSLKLANAGKMGIATATQEEVPPGPEPMSETPEPVQDAEVEEATEDVEETTEEETEDSAEEAKTEA